MTPTTPLSVARDPVEILADVKARLLARGCRLQVDKPSGLRAKCPVSGHQDRRPSFLARCKPNGVQLKCFAGCSTPQMAHALGMNPRDLFVGTPAPLTRRKVMKTYEYLDREGTLVARKTRFSDKTFAWQHPDPHAPGGWTKGFGDPAPGLYRGPALIGASQVFLCEGEKSVDLLVGLGLVASCGTAGAGTWKPSWSATLIDAGCRELVILADHDQPGARHAERVATCVRKHDGSIKIKILDLPGLPPGGDVADFLEAGHPSAELLAIVASTPPWAPGAGARRRAEDNLERHRERTRSSMRSLRAQRRGDSDPASARTASGLDEALAAVVAVLTPDKSNSRNAIWRALKGGPHSRTMIARALEHGATTDVLISEGGGQQGRANLYRLALTHTATGSGKSDIDFPGFPIAATRSVEESAQQTPTFPASVALLRVAPVSSSLLLQGKTSYLNTHSNQIGKAPLNTQGNRIGEVSIGATGNRESEGDTKGAIVAADKADNRGSATVWPDRLWAESDARLREGWVGRDSVRHASSPLRATVDAIVQDDEPDERAAVSADQQQAIATGRCCGLDGVHLLCKLCRWSPTYWQAVKAAS